MSSDAPQSQNDDPAPVNFLLEQYKTTCATLLAENIQLKGEAAFLKQRLEAVDKREEEHDRLKGAYNELKEKHDELKGEHDELKGKHDALRDENASLRRQLGLVGSGQSRTTSRATTSEVRVSVFLSRVCWNDGR